MKTDDFKQKLLYWTEKFKGDLPILQMPTDYPRPAVLSPEGASVEFLISSEQIQVLTALGKKEDATLFMVLLTAYSILLYRYTGQEDICIGSAVANWMLPDTTNVVGKIANTIVLRTQNKGPKTFVEYLRNVRDICIEAYSNQDVPFEQIVKELKIERDFSTTPIFQTLFIFESFYEELDSFNDDIDTSVSHTDISLSISKRGKELNAKFGYCTDLFAEKTIKRIVENYKVLLKGIISNPFTKISELPLLSDWELRKMLIDWNNTDVFFPANECIHEIFESQVKKTPDNIALVFKNEQMTYRELNEKANSLAGVLREIGVKPDMIVGMILNQSTDMIISILAIMKAGGAYLPIDPDFPDDRINYMLEDSGTGILLTTSKLSERAKFPGKNVFLDNPDLFNGNRSNPELVNTPSDLAYIIYTSGTTGRPKGVMIEHMNVVRLMFNDKFQFDFNSRDVWTMFHSYCFDFSVWEMYGALLYGGKLLIISKETARDPQKFLIVLKEEKVTVLNQTPSAFYYLIDAEMKNQVKNLDIRYVIFGGESLKPVKLREWKDNYPHTKLINMYGITETTVHVTFKEIGDCEISRNISNIGRPIPTLTIYVMNENLALQPLGVPGELCVGGLGVARGYLNKPELTNEKFVINPLKPDDRLYRSGDQVKLLENGEIEYLGRIDHQVKIRGFRIELGEIDAVLTTHKIVKECVVMVREDQPGDKKIVAYYLVLDGKQHSDISELRVHLQKKLPEYMIPNHFIHLNNFPITANGKIDRKALPLPSAIKLISNNEYIKPHTEIEKNISETWQNILGVTKIGIKDNFFNIGGHSLSAVEVISRLTKLYDINFQLADFLKEPTIEKLSLNITKTLSLLDNNDKRIIRGEIEPINRVENMVLSSTQSNLWYLYQLNSESTVYNLPYAMKLSGTVDITLLKSSLNELINRHESLRTIFKIEKNIPIQIVIEPTEIKIPVIDFSHLEKNDQEKQLASYLSKQAKKPFDLTERFIFKLSILKMTEDEYILFFMPHHIIFDGTSFDIFFKELFEIYIALRKGDAVSLENLPIQYADYAYWQQQWMKTDDFKQKILYWTKKLKGDLPILQMPTDYPRPAVLSPEGANIDLLISSEQIQGLTEIGKKDDATLFMVLVAAYSILLYRYTGQEDICIGSAVANRMFPETANVVGYFANTIILRTQTKGPKIFFEHLRKVRDICVEAYSNQEVPFEQIVKELKPERDFSRTPIYQTLFVFESFFENEGSVEDIIHWKQEPVNTCIAHTDITVWISKRSNGLNANFEFSTDLFAKETIERLLNNFNTLINGIVSNPEQKITDLPLLTAFEKEKLLISWNDTEIIYPKDKCIHNLLEEQSRRIPEKQALIFENTTLTYSQLNKRSNQLANYLFTLGVGPNVFVGLYFTHSLEMVIAIFAVLKAGGTYIPLDPEYPEDRIKYMVEVTKPPVIITCEKLSSNLFSYNIPVVRVDKDHAKIDQYNDNNPGVEISSKTLAYIIFTSGSTGKPKGVQVQHRNVMNLLKSMGEKPGLTEHDVLLAHTTFSFDMSIPELFLPIAAGAKTVIIGKDTASDGVKLHEFLLKTKITVMQATPTTWRLLLLAGWQGFKDFKILIGAEPIPRDLVNELLPKSSSVWNMYGPTETTVWSTCEQIHETKGPVFIGKPIANTQIYVLDDRMNPVPIGVPGEIYIGGDGVTKGYFKRSDLNSKVFLPDPFNKNTVIYKTGDLGRYHPDGRLEHLARIDKQVKVRGFRIELGEIETVLCEHTSVHQSVVTVREDKKNDVRLVVYTILNSGHTHEVDKLRGFLQSKLPKYMIPQHFVEMDKFPITPAGKIDRKNMPAPSGFSVTEKHEYIAPQTEIEKKISKIWEEELGIDRIGIKDNFFEIGGHSLLAVRVVSILTNEFGINLPLAEFLKDSSIERVSNFIKFNKKSSSELIYQIKPCNRRDDVPLSSSQLGLWYIYELNPKSIVYNLPYAIKFSGPLDIVLLKKSIYGIIQKHESLRTIIKTKENIPFQVLCDTLEFDIPIIDFSNLKPNRIEDSLAKYILEKAKQPFSLSDEVLCRFEIIKMSESAYILLFIINHIIFDGLSFNIFLKELFSTYNAYNNGETNPYTSLDINYADYTVWQKKWILTDDFQKKLAYWLKKLKGSLPVLQMPVDHPRPVVQSTSGANIDMNISDRQIDFLSELGKKEEATLFMVLLATFSVLLHRYTNQEDICIGSPAANRGSLETNKIIGYFTNILVLRTNPEGDQSFIEHLKQIRNLCLDAYSNQDVPFNQIVRELKIERDLSQTPIFQTLFIFEPFFEDFEFLNDDISWELKEIDTSVSHTDISLSISKRGKGLNAKFEYCTDLFSEKTIKRIIENYKVLLEGIISKPHTKISELPLLSDIEYRILLTDWNNTDIPFPKNKCIHEIFESYAIDAPNDIAVKFGDKSVTYVDLNSRANRLAHYLISSGVSSETIVGLCIERSFEMIVAILGILKAGGAYLPIDSEYPLERIKFMLTDTGTVILLTQDKFLKRFSDFNISKICLDTEQIYFNDQSNKNPNLKLNSENLAYVMYTSGSTGRPKGIETMHKNIIRLVKNSNYVSLNKNEILLQYSPISFDASTFEIWGAILNGGRLIICPPGQITYEELGKIINENCVSTIWLTSGLFHNIVEYDTNLLRPVHQILSGGDVLLPTAVKKVLNEIDGIKIINGYGPTENTTFTCCYPMKTINQIESSVPIGYPVSNTKVYILNESMNCVPVGVTGELYTSGDGVARGYLNRPELTKKSFLPDPFSENPDSKLYKTGDLARYLTDGRIEFLGRKDQQVKIKGFRVELGEIESKIAKHKLISQVIVIIKEYRPGDKRLIAYFIPNEVINDYTKELRTYLGKNFPDYMIPQFFIKMESFPLTSNGKIDRKALPLPKQRELISNNVYIKPRTEIETNIAKIWQEQIGIDNISITDNFFEIGGHSLIAVTIFSKLSQQYGLNLPLATLFTAGSIEQLAKVVEDLVNEKNSHNKKYENTQLPWSHIVGIQTNGKKPPLFCVHAVGGNVLNYNVFVSKLGPDQPIYGLQSRGLDGKSEPYRQIETMAKKYVQEIKIIQPSGPYYICGGSMGGLIACEIARQLKQDGQEIPFLAMFDTFTPKLIFGKKVQGLQYVQHHIIKNSFQKMIKEFKKHSFKKQFNKVQKKITHSILKIGKLFLCKLYIYIGRPIPHKLNFFYVENENLKAVFNYNLKTYDGDIILFFNLLNQKEIIDRKNGWTDYINGEIKMIGIPAEHNAFIEDDFLSEKLKTILDQMI